MPRGFDILRLNAQQAQQLAERVGVGPVQQLLDEAARDLARRIRAVGGGATEPLSVAKMRATLDHVQAVTHTLARGIGDTLVDASGEVAETAAGGVLDYLQATQQSHSGQPLPLKEAALMTQAVSGARASLLRSLATTQLQEEEQAADPEAEEITTSTNPMRSGGVLSRYSLATIGQFEGILRTGLLTQKPWGDVRDELTQASPFLQGSPKFWAERVVRTETLSAYNRAGWESVRAADDELGDMVKILSATFDDRTGWDSYQLHGQIRLPDEAFDWAEGAFQHPPNRPNDREVVIPQRIAWPLPPELAWRSDAEVMAAWKRNRRKGSPPQRPQMTTVDLARFGKG